MSIGRNIICVDFDGVIHGYAGYSDKVDGRPIGGSFDFLNNLLDARFKVVILSARANDPNQAQLMKKWFIDNGFKGIDELEITSTKPSAVMYIDDRAYKFDGSNFPTVKQIENFEPWWKKNGSMAMNDMVQLGEIAARVAGYKSKISKIMSFAETFAEQQKREADEKAAAKMLPSLEMEARKIMKLISEVSSNPKSKDLIDKYLKISENLMSAKTPDDLKKISNDIVKLTPEHGPIKIETDKITGLDKWKGQANERVIAEAQNNIGKLYGMASSYLNAGNKDAYDKIIDMASKIEIDPSNPAKAAGEAAGTLASEAKNFKEYSKDAFQKKFGELPVGQQLASIFNPMSKLNNPSLSSLTLPDILAKNVESGKIPQGVADAIVKQYNAYESSVDEARGMKISPDYIASMSNKILEASRTPEFKKFEGSPELQALALNIAAKDGDVKAFAKRYDSLSKNPEEQAKFVEITTASNKAAQDADALRRQANATPNRIESTKLNRQADELEKKAQVAYNPFEKAQAAKAALNAAKSTRDAAESELRDSSSGVSANVRSKAAQDAREAYKKAEAAFNAEKTVTDKLAPSVASEFKQESEALKKASVEQEPKVKPSVGTAITPVYTSKGDYQTTKVDTSGSVKGFDPNAASQSQMATNIAREKVLASMVKPTDQQGKAIEAARNTIPGESRAGFKVEDIAMKTADALLKDRVDSAGKLVQSPYASIPKEDLVAYLSGDQSKRPLDDSGKPLSLGQWSNQVALQKQAEQGASNVADAGISKKIEELKAPTKQEELVRTIAASPVSSEDKTFDLPNIQKPPVQVATKPDIENVNEGVEKRTEEPRTLASDIAKINAQRNLEHQKTLEAIKAAGKNVASGIASAANWTGDKLRGASEYALGKNMPLIKINPEDLLPKMPSLDLVKKPQENQPVIKQPSPMVNAEKDNLDNEDKEKKTQANINNIQGDQMAATDSSNMDWLKAFADGKDEIAAIIPIIPPIPQPPPPKKDDTVIAKPATTEKLADIGAPMSGDMSNTKMMYDKPERCFNDELMESPGSMALIVEIDPESANDGCPCMSFSETDRKSNACPQGKCIQKVGDKWRIYSGKDGHVWPQKFDSQELAYKTLQAYETNK